MKFLMIAIFTLFTLPAVAGFEGKQDGTSLKIFNKIDCTTGMTCSRSGNGDFTITADVPAAGSITSSQILDGTIVEADTAVQAEGLNIDRLAIFDYDFAVDGGTSGSHTTSVELPANAVIEKCWFRVETQLVDAGAGTLAVQCEDADNILTAADQTGVAAGSFLASNITGAAAAMVDDIAAACDITWVIGGADLTAGKVRGYCRYSVHE